MTTWVLTGDNVFPSRRHNGFLGLVHASVESARGQAHARRQLALAHLAGVNETGSSM